MNDAPLLVPTNIIRASGRPKSCDTCRFLANESGDRVCRRNPPQVSILLVPLPPPYAGQHAPKPFASFPPVNRDMWCGEWSQRMDG